LGNIPDFNSFGRLPRRRPGSSGLVLALHRIWRAGPSALQTGLALSPIRLGLRVMEPQTRQEIAPKTMATLEEEHPMEAFHVCLAGSSVSNNWALIESLKHDYQVTVIESFDLLLRNDVLSSVDVLLLNCEEGGEAALETLRSVKRKFPKLCVVLVNGGLTQNEIAAGFREGVKDYFPHHFNVPLLVERVQYLCSQSRRNTMNADRAH
jgi:hypothetical protein